MLRQQTTSGTPWEASVGYSRAVRVGNQVFVSGTTASDENGRTVFVGDAFEQTRFILKKIAVALSEVGANFGDVTRTRMFVTDISKWEEIGKAHCEVFGAVRPAATMVEVRRLVSPDHLVEIEVDAVVACLSTEIGFTFIESAITSFRANKELADKAFAQLPDDNLQIALDANTNSIAVIVKHVAGNLASRWTDFLTSDGEKPWRNRDDEFVDTFADRGELLRCWEDGWNCLFATLQSLGPRDLSKTVSIRGEPHSIPLAIHRSLAHCGYHVGQIVMIARILAGDNWNTITIPRGESGSYNQAVWGKGHYRT